MGAGALGTVVGGLMAKAGHQVTLVGRQAHLHAIDSAGLRIIGIWGHHTVRGLTLREDVHALSRGDYDLIVIAVKSYDTEAAARAIARLVDDETLVCSYQNGLGNIESIAAVVGPEQCFGARVIYGARITEPGLVEVTVIAQPTALGCYEMGPPEKDVRAISSEMDEAGLPTVFTDSIETVLWSKVAYNCALNPISALLNIPYGVVGETSRALIEEVIRELYAVGAARGVALKPSTAEEYVDLFFDVLLPPTQEHYASMREDFLRKRRTEIGALNGAICRFAEEHGAIDTPVNRTLTQLVMAREASYLSGR